MKKFVGVAKIIVIVLVALLVVRIGLAQEATESRAQKLDTRIWSQSYWLDMAKLGFVEVAPEVPLKEAVYTSSRIDAPGVVTDDSPDVPVTDDPNTTQSENSVFIHPLDINILLNSNNSTDWPVNVLYGADALYTTDGGATWDGQIQGAGGFNSGDPAAVIGRNGWYYVGYIADNYGQGVAHSTDGGNSWTHVQVAGGGYILDKNHLWIDNSLSSPYEGNLYSAWTNFQGGANDGEIELSRSTDEGLSWSTSINISSAVSAGSHNQGVNIETGPNGEVYVAWSIYDYWPSDETAIGFTRSTDGGATFEPATRIIENIRGIRYTLTSKNMRVNSFPVMSVDLSGGLNSGTIYLVWANIGVPGVNVGPDIDIYMIKSSDGGSAWSAPLKVNQDSSGLGKEHYFPWITCDPALGALSVIFYDDRNVSSTDCEVFVASSVDAGATWIDFKVSDVSFTPSPIPGLAGGYFGDYLGISGRGGKVYPAWTDNRDGRAMTYVSPFALEEDTIPPASVTDLAVAEVGSNWITLTWTASGDDGDSGKATAYDIRYSTSLIDSINFDLATPVSNPPFPQEAGFTEVFTVDGLDFNTTYYFALKVNDEWGNISSVSNCPSETTLGIPDIVVSPDSLVDSLLTGETSIHILTIRNVGEGTLDFFFPQFDGEAALRLTSVEGDRLSFRMIPHMTEDIPWLSVYPTEGTVLSGESTDIEVTFDASGLYGGDYFTDIIIASNDPDEPEVIVPAHLHVTGAPDIAVSEDTLDYGIVFIGASVTDTLIVSNEGTDLLTVSDIVSDNSDYTVDTTSFSLLPEESQEVLVTFTPSTTGQITGTLTITSDDPDEPIVTVFLQGEGVEPPDIFVTPDSLSDSLFTGETSTQWLTIYNEGVSDLIFDISIENMTKAELIVLSETEFVIMDFVNSESAMPMSNSESGEKFSPEVIKRIYKSSTTNPNIRDVNILVMEEIGAGTYHYDTALNNLGLSRTFVTSWSALQAELTGGTEWYLVIVNSYSNYPSPSVLDDLNDYISTGGRLMYADWAVYNYPGHNLLQSLGISFVSDFTTPKDFSAVDNTHQIFKYPNEVDSFYWTDDQANRDGEIVDTLPGASQLAAFEGFPNSGAIVLSPSNTCIFNAFQAANFNGDHDLDGKLDIVELIENEITLLLGGVAWLSVFPTSGTVPADSSIDIEVTFDATGLYGGDYFADIVISSNDPDEPEVTVPAHLHVTGAPDIVVSEDTLDYGVVFIGESVTDTLIVSNEGTDLLTVSDIVSDHSDYTVDTTSFSLAPGERQDVLVTFTPSTTGQITGTLTITSDDPDEPIVTVFLHGEGAEPPDIFVTPDSLSDSLFTGETSIHWLTIYNEGVSDLIFDITIEEPDTGRGGVHIRSRSFRRNPDVGLVSQGSLQQGNNNVWSNKAPFGYQPRRTERSGITRAGDSVLVIQDAAPWGSTAHEQILAANGIDYYMINSSDIGSVDFSNYKVVLIPSDQPTSFYETVASFSDKFDSFVESGGILEFHAAGWGWNGGNASLVTLPGAMNINQYYSPINYVLDPSHPVVQGVPNPFTGTDASHAHFTNIPVNALEIVEDDGGNTNLVEYTYGSGVVIAGGQTFEYGYDNGQGAGIILANLIPYAFYFEVGISWLSVDPGSGTVPADSSIDIEVTFDATGLYGGDYFADIIISSNDPDEPEVTVPAYLHVTGAPDIVVSEDTLDYGIVFIGASVTDTLVVSNEGTDLLTVSDIVSDHSDYTVDTTSFSLPPEESQDVLVTFTPSTTGQITGTLTITSDDPDEPTVTVALVGEGLMPPIMIVNPESMSDTLYTGESAIHIMTIGNIGGSDLVFEITEEPIEGMKLSAREISPFMPHSSLRPKEMRQISLLNPYVKPASQKFIASSHGQKWGRNHFSASGTPLLLAGTYTGDYVHFGLSDYGEIMPFQCPVGTEHLRVGGYYSGYTVCYNNGTDHVAWAGYDDRWGIVPVSYTEVVNNLDEAIIDVVTQTSGGEVTITQRFTFDKHDKFILIETNLENTSGGALTDVVFKKWADWDMDNDFDDDNWDYDSTHNMIYAWDVHYGTIAGETPPDYRDIDGWDDYSQRITDEDYPSGPVTYFDGLEILHYEVGALSPSEATALSFAYGAADGLSELQEVIERAMVRVEWLSAYPDTGTVPAGGSAEIEVTFDASGMYGGNYAAYLLISSNDPATPVDTVPCFLHVIAAPDIELSTDTLHFDTVLVGFSDTLELQVYNTGVETLLVTSVISDNPDYTVDTANFFVPADDSQTVRVIFTPDDEGLSTGNLAIESNDPDESTVTVVLIGNGKTGIAESETEMVVPKNFSVSQICPNPFSRHAVIHYACPYRSTVALKIYDVAGKLVRTLLNENSEAGYYTLIWEGRDNAGEKVSSGVYFLKFTAENYSATRKLHVIR